MNTTVMPKELEKYINNLLNCDALEMIETSEETPKNLHIPYMMNDALENYLVLENCQITGSFSKTLPSDTILEVIEKNSFNEKNALIFHKPDGNVITIWFSNCQQVIAYYQYHRIGHFWTEGFEHWRRLVYIIGTLHEKFTYLGGESCNDHELKLMHLMEFGPFRHWSPIHESLDDYFPNTENGLFFMHQFALEAKDTAYARWIRFYRRFPFKFICNILSKKLVSEKRESLYQLINQKIDQASETYAVRDYGPDKNAEIKKIRTQFSNKLYADGFTGQYPVFQKGDIHVIAMEEHPFTISELEYENFHFKIRGMVTENGCHYLYHSQ